MRATIRGMAAAGLMLAASLAFAQNPTATGTINATLINKNGIAIVFDTDPAGVTLGGAGTSAATANFGTISAFGPLAAGVTRPALTSTTYTVRTVFDIQVIQGGLTSPSYSLNAQMASATPAGLSYAVDSITLANGNQTIQAAANYNVDVPHNLDLIVSRAAPGAGGPAVGVPLTATINFSVSAN